MARHRRLSYAARPTSLRISAGVRTCRPKLAQAGGLRRFRKLAAVGVEDQPVVVIDRRRQIEQRLQHAVHAGRPEQVLAAHHMGDALHRVVEHDREMIAGRRLLAADDHVAPGRGIGRDLAGLAGRARRRSRSSAAARSIPSPWSCRGGWHRARPRRCAPAGPPPASAAPRRDRPARRRDRAASARARRGRRPCARARRGSRSREGQPQRIQRRQRRAVLVEMRGLPPHRLLPLEAEPGEVFSDRRLELGPAARRVDVLDAQQEPPACARAMSKLSSADSAWPRCRGPFGLGAKRKTGCVIDRRGTRLLQVHLCIQRECCASGNPVRLSAMTILELCPQFRAAPRRL